MIIREISFFKQFKCTGGSCEHTCCRGWMIPLTKEDLTRFRKEKGLLRLAIEAERSSKDIQCFNKGSLSCSFHNKDGLCSLQLKRGHDFIPEACRMFPRFYRNYTEFEEHYLDPACTKAASLLLENAGHLTLDETSGEPLSDPCTTNDDSTFLNDLVNTRASVISRFRDLNDAGSLNEAMNDVYEYSLKLQEACLNGDTSFLASHPFSGFKAKDKLQLFPFTSGTLGGLMDTSFYHVRLKKTNPFLYRLCRLYFDRYDPIMSTQASWDRASDEFIKANKEAVPLSTAYYAYYLYLYFLKSFEDYSFLKNAALGMIHVNMIFMFSLLLSLDEPSSYPDRLSEIISNYDRRACFNDEIMSEMYSCLHPSSQ